MRCAPLVHFHENEEPTPRVEERPCAAYVGFQDELVACGAFVSQECLRPTSLSTIVRLRDGGCDRRWVGTAEQIAGFFVVETATSTSRSTWPA